LVVNEGWEWVIAFLFEEMFTNGVEVGQELTDIATYLLFSFLLRRKKKLLSLRITEIGGEFRIK